MNYYFEAFKKYAEFKGRSSRKAYWYFVLFNIIVGMILSVLSGDSNSILVRIYQLAAFIPSLAVAVRRMHDVGKSGWYLLIPIYNLILACTAGDKGDNKYGPAIG